MDACAGTGHSALRTHFLCWCTCMHTWTIRCNLP